MTSTLFRGGSVFQGASRTLERKDVRIGDGLIKAIADDLPREDGECVVDISGRILSPGLIDMHVHAFRHGHFLSLDVDSVAPSSGTTCFVDAGSCGVLQFPAFREYVIKPARARIYAFLNISAIGQTTDGITGLDFHDNDHDALLHLESARETIETNRDTIIGIKVRVYTGLKSMKAMEVARELADIVQLPIMVHTAPAPPSFEDMIHFLAAGDIITHPYHGGTTTILDDDGRIRQSYWDARKRGIEVDFGPARFHCELPIMQSCFDQGYWPDYISTDLVTLNRDAITIDLPTSMSKALACGMPLQEVLARSTIDPARKLGADDEIGVLREGATADLAVLRVEQGHFVFVDGPGNRLQATQRIVADQTYIDGELLEIEETSEDLPDFVNRAIPWKNYTMSTSEST
jgi:dihydroorotase